MNNGFFLKCVRSRVVLFIITLTLATVSFAAGASLFQSFADAAELVGAGTNQSVNEAGSSTSLPESANSPVKGEEPHNPEDLVTVSSLSASRWGGGIPGGKLQGLSFETDNEEGRLEKWPEKSLVYRQGRLYLKTASGERLLFEGRIEYPGWPQAVVTVGDIDFDGEPDFFVLLTPSASGSFLYTLIDWDRKRPDGTPFFAPFREENFPPPPDDPKECLFLIKDRLPNPHFEREAGYLEFINRKGPYYDTERWCFDGSGYYLCEKIKQSYYAHADNMFQLARHVRFDRQGKVESIFCRSLSDENLEERLVADADVALFAEPGQAGRKVGLWKQDKIAVVLDYRLITVDYSVKIWLKVKLEDAPDNVGWCCVLVKSP